MNLNGSPREPFSHGKARKAPWLAYRKSHSPAKRTQKESDWLRGRANRSVSYTHLDVYKRQTRLPMHRRARLGIGYLAQEPSIFRKLTVDVYKRQGLISLTLQQIEDLKALGKNVSLLVSVGDIFPLFLGGRNVKAPMLFLSTAKSEYIQGHLGIECRLMRKYAGLVLARDERTAKALQQRGVPARCAGNVMMDGFAITGESFGLNLKKRVVGILPGSREEAYRNMKTLLQAVSHLTDFSGDNLDYVVGLAPNLDEDRLCLLYTSRCV